MVEPSAYHARAGRGSMRRQGGVLSEMAFELDLAHGRCVGVRIPATLEALDRLAESTLAAEERAFAAEMAPLRRRTWIAGRAALRQALQQVGLDAPPVLVDSRGAPALPDGVAGSISHKEELAVALVARGTARVGVDLERDIVRPVDITAKVLTDAERAALAGLDDAERAREVLLRFSLKEAMYKALDPFVRRYVGFREVAVTPRASGEVTVETTLRAGERPFAIEATWRRFDGWILTTARVTPRT